MPKNNWWIRIKRFKDCNYPWKNGAYGVALNKAIEKASGEYIGIIETDDFIDSNMFEDLYNLAKKFDADIAKSDWFVYHTQEDKSFKVGLIPSFLTNRVTNVKKIFIFWTYLHQFGVLFIKEIL